MAQVDIAPSFGAELKDGFKPVNAWVSGGIAWIDDIQAFYRERSAIEKEYASKLSALAKKYFEKKAKKSSALSVGETPVVTPGSLESASMSTWQTQLTTLEQRAAEHDKFAASILTNLAEPLRIHSARFEDLRKLHADYANKLEKERDGAYSELRKQKDKYDSVCQGVESKRKKVDTNLDGKSKGQQVYQQQLSEMNNAKNTYLITINVTNKQKERYYHEYVPDLLDSLQDLNETRVSKLNSIWSLAATIETQTLAQSTEYLNHLSAEIPRNQPTLDSMMFARHNAANWQEPGNVGFEPSPVWLDEGTIANDELSKNFLRNILMKSKGSVSTLRVESDGCRREVDQLRRARIAIREGRDNRDEVDVVKAIFDMQTSLHEIERQKTTAEVEISTITTAVGDISLGAQKHNFKSETFKIPTNCDYCGERIWGLSAKGFSCRDCGFTCHSKCEMKAPADCPGELSKEEKKKVKLDRQIAAQEAALTAPATNGSMRSSDNINHAPQLHRSDTMNTLSSGYSIGGRRSASNTTIPQTTTIDDDGPPAQAAPAPAGRRRMVAPPPTTYNAEPETEVSNEQRGRMLYAFSGTGPGEISVTEGQEVTIIESDDGGWTKVRHRSEEGLVPTSYMEILPSAPASAAPPSHTAHLAARPASTYSTSSVSLAGSVNGSPAIGSTGGKKKGPAVAPKRGAKKLQYVEALYDYDGRSDAEHSMREGDRLVLVKGDTGDGWIEVEKGGVVRSVPANYTREV